MVVVAEVLLTTVVGAPVEALVAVAAVPVVTCGVPAVVLLAVAVVVVAVVAAV